MIQFVTPSRYALVSIICLITHNIVMIVTATLKQSIPVATMESFAIVIVIGYLLHSRYTFAVPRSWLAFLRYGTAMAANLPSSIAFVWVFARLIGWPMAIAAPAATAAMIGINFFASRWAVAPRLSVERIR